MRTGLDGCEGEAARLLAGCAHLRRDNQTNRPAAGDSISSRRREATTLLRAQIISSDRSVATAEKAQSRTL